MQRYCGNPNLSSPVQESVRLDSAINSARPIALDELHVLNPNFGLDFMPLAPRVSEHRLLNLWDLLHGVLAAIHSQPFPKIVPWTEDMTTVRLELEFVLRSTSLNVVVTTKQRVCAFRTTHVFVVPELTKSPKQHGQSPHQRTGSYRCQAGYCNPWRSSDLCLHYCESAACSTILQPTVLRCKVVLLIVVAFHSLHLSFLDQIQIYIQRLISSFHIIFCLIKYIFLVSQARSFLTYEWLDHYIRWGVPAFRLFRHSALDCSASISAHKVGGESLSCKSCVKPI